MSIFTSVKAKDFIKVVEKLGFYFDRQKGSHAIYKHNDGRRVVIPIHSGKDIKQGTLTGMIQDVGIDKETFFNLLGK
ncbi:type II toxin-antitoxin system HicA family toxin [Dolichospermum planctonicum CS-1226]|uniref:Type II toxin-antitoxin system HicA family toxin n=1 Tax=Dolichospermum planctonicum CS-1226 TaxID=3021751 RepID=A0ABT5AD69_9CYAN|nr:type II toxin-antitoxin system HicA family toxin [Dolichospermum planctonicum]MDB9535229.1 type II toxin-antitoxin system HicA family toxin [Dolichospermum planctonicum CS-1226]